MNPYKALVLEGFFKQNWEVVQPLPYESIKDFFASRRPPREINYTILPLFPKLAALKQRPNMNRSVCIIQYTRGSQKFSLMECILCDGGLSILFRVHSYHIGSFTIIYSLPIKLWINLSMWKVRGLTWQSNLPSKKLMTTLNGNLYFNVLKNQGSMTKWIAWAKSVLLQFRTFWALISKSVGSCTPSGGIHQGDSLLSCLFIIYMEAFTKRLFHEVIKPKSGIGIKILP